MYSLNDLRNMNFHILLLFFIFSLLSLFSRCHCQQVDVDQKLEGEIVKMGCFDYWSGMVEIYPYAPKPWDERYLMQPPLFPEDCVSKCKSWSWEGSVAMVKGVFCMCTRFYHFKKQQIDESYCDFVCGSDLNTYENKLKVKGQSFENTTMREEFSSCGGNIGVSAYCREGVAGCFERSLNQNQNSLPSRHSDEQIPKPILVQAQVFDSESPISSQCAVCSKSDEESITTKDVDKCLIKTDLIGTTYPALDYFPLNSPTACINQCRNLYYSLAVLQWTYFEPSLSLPLPICRCFNEDLTLKSNWKLNMSDVHCMSHCPGNKDAKCGKVSSELDAQTSAWVSILCAVDGQVCKSLGIGDGVIDFTTPVDVEETEGTTKSFTEEDRSSTSFGEGPTITELITSTSEPTTTTSEPTTATSSTTTTKTTSTTTKTTPKSTAPSTSTTTQNTTPEQLTSEPPTSAFTTKAATKATTSAFTTKNTTTTMPPSCEIICTAVDLFDQTWTGCRLQTVEKPCEGGNSSYKGVARWRCSSTGHFEGRMPDISNCSSVWPADLWMIFRNLTNNITDPLSKEMSENLLEIMENRSRVSEMNKVPYYGHEIKRIASLIWNVVNQSSVDFDERTRLISKGNDVASILLLNQNPWQHLNEKDKAEAGTKILESFEFSMFTLSQHVHGEEEQQQKYSYQLNFTQRGTADFRKSEYQSTFGAVSRKDSSKKQPLVFPLEATAQSSFIRLSEGWEDLIGVEIPEFVGISLDSKYIKDALPSANKSLELNGRLLSLTLKGLEQESQKKLNLKNLQGNKVTITFQHDIEATEAKSRMWKPYSQPFTRQTETSDDEKSFVVGSAICVFWNPEKMEWATDGCTVVESNQTCTICECSHLTSFALLMDSDPQHAVTTGFGLELLTFILCPASVICLLASFVIFSSAGSTMREKTKTQITKHLSVCLLLGNLALLLVVDRSYFNLHKGLCTAVGMATHYLFLCAFAWMEIEGIHLYKLIVLVFESERNYELLYKICAYTVPLVIVILTSLIGFVGNAQNPYDGEEFCWLKGDYIWSFMGPVAFTIATNNIILFLAYKTARQIKANTTTAFMRKKQGNHRMWIRGSFSITIILGLTWLPGFFIATDSTVISTIAAYIFVILNASQGIFIFIFHCWMNDAVWSRAKRNFARFNAISGLRVVSKGSKNTNTKGTNTFFSTQEISSKST